MAHKVRDAFALAGARFGTQLNLLLLTPIAARLMTEAEFGVWALLMAVSKLAQIFAEAGINVFVIRELELGPKEKWTSFWLTVLLGAGVAVLCGVAAVPVSSFLGIREWTTALVLLATTFPVLSASAHLTALLRREKRFGVVFLADTLRNAAFFAVSAVLLVNDYGLWAYIAATFAAPYVTLLMGVLFCGLPRRHFDTAVVRRIFNYVSGLLGFNLVNYWARSLDDVLVGRFLGTVALGSYSVAYRLMLLPISEVGSLLNLLLLPYIAPHQHDLARVRRDILRGTQVVGLITIPAMTLLWLNRDLLITWYLGPGWQSVTDLLFVLAPVGMLQLLISPVGLIFQTTGRTRQFFLIGMLNASVVLAFVAFGVQFDLMTVAWCYAIGNVLMLYPNVEMGARSAGGRFWEWAKGVAPLMLIPISNAWILFLPVAESRQHLLLGGTAASIAGATAVVAFIFYRRLVGRIVQEFTRALPLRQRQTAVPSYSAETLEPAGAGHARETAPLCNANAE